MNSTPDATVENTTSPTLTERNPNHAEALTKDDLRVGRKVKRERQDVSSEYYLGPRRSNSTEFMTIESKPFWRSGPTGSKGGNWMVRVCITARSGDLHRDEYLSDMGVIPYVNSDGRHDWNEFYILAVE